MKLSNSLDACRQISHQKARYIPTIIGTCSPHHSFLMNTDITIASYLADPMDTVKDVSPYVTGLIGFAGRGLVTAMFGASLSSCSCPQIAL